MILGAIISKGENCYIIIYLKDLNRFRKIFSRYRKRRGIVCKRDIEERKRRSLDFVVIKILSQEMSAMCYLDIKLIEKILILVL